MIRTCKTCPVWHTLDHFNPALFLSTMHAVCELMSWRHGGMQKLRNVHRILALLPQAGRHYSVEAFAQEIYLLDRHAHDAALKSGLAFSLDAGSTGARRRSNLLIVLSSQGAEHAYYGIEFHTPHRLDAPQCGVGHENLRVVVVE
jgi:hypothetical protein